MAAASPANTAGQAKNCQPSQPRPRSKMAFLWARESVIRLIGLMEAATSRATFEHMRGPRIHHIVSRSTVV
ncbi:hypothetical protein IG631_12800 [Alternaria alternata]|nr:hypothetical protein IG631_12800 [Alternaria alternata]